LTMLLTKSQYGGDVSVVSQQPPTILYHITRNWGGLENPERWNQ